MADPPGTVNKGRPFTGLKLHYGMPRNGLMEELRRSPILPVNPRWLQRIAVPTDFIVAVTKFVNQYALVVARSKAPVDQAGRTFTSFKTIYQGAKTSVIYLGKFYNDLEDIFVDFVRYCRGAVVAATHADVYDIRRPLEEPRSSESKIFDRGFSPDTSQSVIEWIKLLEMVILRSEAVGRYYLLRTLIAKPNIFKFLRFRNGANLACAVLGDASCLQYALPSYIDKLRGTIATPTTVEWQIFHGGMVARDQFRKLPVDFRKTKAVAMIAAGYHGFIVWNDEATKKFRRDDDFALQALTSDGTLLMHLGKKRSDMKFVEVAVRSNPLAIKYAANKLREDPAFVQLAFDMCMSGNDAECMIERLRWTKMQNNYDFVARLCAVAPLGFYDALPSNVKDKTSVVISAVRNCATNAMYIPRRFFGSSMSTKLQICRSVVQENGEALAFIAKNIAPHGHDGLGEFMEIASVALVYDPRSGKFSCTELMATLRLATAWLTNVHNHAGVQNGVFLPDDIVCMICSYFTPQMLARASQQRRVFSYKRSGSDAAATAKRAKHGNSF